MLKASWFFNIQNKVSAKIEVISWRTVTQSNASMGIVLFVAHGRVHQNDVA